MVSFTKLEIKDNFLEQVHWTLQGKKLIHEAVGFCAKNANVGWREKGDWDLPSFPSLPRLPQSCLPLAKGKKNGFSTSFVLTASKVFLLSFKPQGYSI